MIADPLSTFAPGLFVGRAVIVTGGGRGIGRRTALAFARLGADVTIAARNPDTLAATSADITALGKRVVSRVTNIREVDDVDALVAAHMAEFGRLDLLVNNAGGQFPARPSEITDRGFRSVVDLNLHGTWNVCSRAVPHMITTRSDHGRAGSIVNVVHNQVLDRGAVLFAHSGAARAGVVNLTHTMALYLARHRITVTRSLQARSTPRDFAKTKSRIFRPTWWPIRLRLFVTRRSAACKHPMRSPPTS
jgi:NAD(P)-dependent dehydrogenase (short-subunit alcohol dehydrogenase family)